MLTKITAVTGAVTAVANALILFGILDWTAEQIAGVNVAIVAVGGLVHAYFNPSIPWVGTSDAPSGDS